jgi:hypothetical protein
VQHARIILPLWMFHPFAKWVTSYPQVVLGIAFGCYIFVCCSVFGVDVFAGGNSVNSAAMFAN